MIVMTLPDCVAVTTGLLTTELPTTGTLLTEVLMTGRLPTGLPTTGLMVLDTLTARNFQHGRASVLEIASVPWVHGSMLNSQACTKSCTKAYSYKKDRNESKHPKRLSPDLVPCTRWV